MRACGGIDGVNHEWTRRDTNDGGIGGIRLGALRGVGEHDGSSLPLQVASFLVRFGDEDVHGDAANREAVRPTDVDLNLAGMVLERNGELFSTAAGAAVQGGPVNAVVWLANTLGALGIPFLAGEVILSGSQSTLVPCAPGDTLRCSVGGIGSCEIHFSGVAA